MCRGRKCRMQDKISVICHVLFGSLAFFFYSFSLPEPQSGNSAVIWSDSMRMTFFLSHPFYFTDIAKQCLWADYTPQCIFLQV